MSTSGASFLRAWPRLAAIVLILAFLFPNQVVLAQGATLMVNTAADELNLDGDCSLREAIQAANLNLAVDLCPAGSGAATDTVKFGVTGAISLSDQLTVVNGGPLVIDGGGVITVRGGNVFRVFNVNSGVVLTVQDLTVTGGVAESGGGIYNAGSLTLLRSSVSDNSAIGSFTGGAGIYNAGTLTITDSTVSGNYTVYHTGGGIFNVGTLTITNSSLSNNGASHDGGAIYSNGSASILNSTLDGNGASYYGGAIYNAGALSLVKSTLHSNHGLYGGAIYNHANATATLANTTLSGNDAGNDGGAIYNDGAMILANSTLTANQATQFGGGLKGNGLGLSLRNTILAGNSSTTSGPDCALMDAHSDGYNLIGNSTDCAFVAASGDKIGTSVNPISPGLGPLQDNGGTTLTHALLEGSPAIDAGNPSAPGGGGVTCEATDQRGVARPQNNRCDMGAYEYLKVTFTDVDATYWAWSFVERLYAAGITGGCASNPLKYCPEGVVTRAQMAVFLLRGIHGASYTPPGVGASTGFGDVPPSYWSATFIKQLAAEGITTGCGNGNYCPEHPVTRAQMAVFLLRSKHGASYTPPGVGAGTGFGDVPPDYWAATWIKQLVAEAITSGCGSGIYCPEQAVTRAQMAVFLVKTFNLP